MYELNQLLDGERLISSNLVLQIVFIIADVSKLTISSWDKDHQRVLLNSINYLDCSEPYIGQTKRYMRERFKEHKQAVNEYVTKRSSKDGTNVYQPSSF